MKLVVRRDLDGLRRLRRQPLDAEDRRRAVDDAGYIGPVHAIGDNVAAGEHVARLRVPNEIGIGRRTDHLERCLAPLEAGKRSGLRVKRRDADRSQRGIGRRLR